MSEELLNTVAKQDKQIADARAQTLAQEAEVGKLSSKIETLNDQASGATQVGRMTVQVQDITDHLSEKEQEVTTLTIQLEETEAALRKLIKTM